MRTENVKFQRFLFSVCLEDNNCKIIESSTSSSKAMTLIVIKKYFLINENLDNDTNVQCVDMEHIPLVLRVLIVIFGDTKDITSEF